MAYELTDIDVYKKLAIKHIHNTCELAKLSYKDADKYTVSFQFDITITEKRCKREGLWTRLIFWAFPVRPDTK